MPGPTVELRETGLLRLERRFGGAAGRVRKGIVAIMKHQGRLAVRRMRHSLQAPPSGVPYPEGPRGPIARRSGDLYRSIGSEVEVSPRAGEVTLRIGVLRADEDSVVEVYARTQEAGALIQGRGKRLAFPPGWPDVPARDARGVQIHTPASIRETWRTWATEKAILGVPLGAPHGTEPTLLFHLRPYVVIPARPFVRPQRTATEIRIFRQIRAFLRQTFGGGHGSP